MDARGDSSTRVRAVLVTGPPTPPPPRTRRRRFKTSAGVRTALAFCHRGLETGTMEPAKARALTYGYSVLAGSFKTPTWTDGFPGMRWNWWSAMHRRGLRHGRLERAVEARGEPYSERQEDNRERRCPRCRMLLWPNALARPLRFHDLRHTAATLLLRGGVPAHHVQRILRHRDVRTTTAIYGHLDVEDLRPAMALLPASLLGSGGLPGGYDSARFGAPVVQEAQVQKVEGPGLPVSRGIPGPSEWALLVSNQRPPPCEDGALPLS